MYKLDRCIGHRGLKYVAPENTLAGIRAAHAAKLKWVEIDVRLSKDGVAVLSHDPDLSRRGGLKKKLTKFTAAELKEKPVHAGFSGYDAADPDISVPTLADAFALMRELDMGAVVELKRDAGNEEAVLLSLLPVVDKAPPRGWILSSFSRRMLLTAQQCLPGIPRAFISKKVDPVGTPKTLRQCKAVNLHFGWGNRRLSQDEIVERVRQAVAVAQSADCETYCWTVNNPELARAIIEQGGAEGVFSDNAVQIRDNR